MAETGSLDVMDHLYKNSIPILHKERIGRLAARHGNLRILQRLYNNVKLDCEIFLEACRGGHLHILNHYRYNIQRLRYRLNYEDMLAMGAKRADISLLQCLQSMGFNSSLYTLYAAASRNDIQSFSYIYDRIENINQNQWSYFMVVATIHGHTNIVRYCCERGNSVTDGVFEKAIEKEHVDILAYLLENNYSWPSGFSGQELYQRAVKNGNPSILYLLDLYHCAR